MVKHASIIILHFHEEIFKNSGKTSKGSQHAKVKDLMEKTKIRRYKWIRLSPQPLVSEITAKFPHLRQNKWVSNTFKLTVTLSTIYFSSDGNLSLLHYVNMISLPSEKGGWNGGRS